MDNKKYFTADKIYQKEYVRGIVDTCGFVRRSNRDQEPIGYMLNYNIIIEISD